MSSSCGRACAGTRSPRQRARAHGGGRQVHVRALPHRQGQSQPARARAGRPGRGRRPATRCGSSSRSRSPGSSTPSPRRRPGSSPRRPWRSSAISRSPRPSSAPGRGCSSATSRARASRIVRNPNYFVPGLPYVDGVEVSIDTDPSAAFASFITGRYDFGPEYGQVVRRSDLEVALQKIPRLQTEGLHRGVRRHHLDEARPGAVQGRARAPRARHGQQLARGARDQCVVAGQGRCPNPAIPAALKEWSIPIDQLPPEGRRLYEPDIPARPSGSSPRPACRTASRRRSRRRPATAPITWTPSRSGSRTGRRPASS